MGAIRPSTVPLLRPVAYVRDLEDTDIHRFETGAGAAPFIASAAFDYNPQYHRTVDGSPSDRASGRTRPDLAGRRRRIGRTRLTRGPVFAPGVTALVAERWHGRLRLGGRERTVGYLGDRRGRVGIRQITSAGRREHAELVARRRFVYYGSIETDATRSGASPPPDRTRRSDAQRRLPPLREPGRPNSLYLRARGGELLARPTAGGEERSISVCRHVGLRRWSARLLISTVEHRELPPMLPVPCASGTRHGTGPRDRAPGRGIRPVLGLSVSPMAGDLQRFSVGSQLMMVENFR